jgi:heat shock protein HspQ
MIIEIDEMRLTPEPIDRPPRNPQVKKKFEIKKIFEIDEMRLTPEPIDRPPRNPQVKRKQKKYSK